MMFYQKATLIRKWALKGNQPKVKTTPGREKTGYFGLVNLTTGRLITENSNQFDQSSFRDFLETVLYFTEEYRKVIILLDNAKWHHAKRIQAFLQKHSNRIELLFLPPYSPELNPIERVWKLTRKRITHNHFFCTMAELRCELMSQFFWWNTDYNNPLRTLCANI